MTHDHLIEAIQLIRQGQWDQAHELVQSGRDPFSCWIHAWLHRQEGDLSNANYWYSAAGKGDPYCDLQEELERIADELSVS